MRFRLTSDLARARRPPPCEHREPVQRVEKEERQHERPDEQNIFVRGSSRCTHVSRSR
jgi:hypothetical protein